MTENFRPSRFRFRLGTILFVVAILALFEGNAHQTDDRRPESPFGKLASVDQTEAG
jgi:hypothetical protein